jgi:Domain of unknown function (DUF4160)
MPTISIFFGFVVEMYWRDHNPPHIHVWYQGAQAIVSIETGEIIGGRLPRTAVRIIRDWVSLRRAELMENWEKGRRHEPFNAVPGADVE